MLYQQIRSRPCPQPGSLGGKGGALTLDGKLGGGGCRGLPGHLEGGVLLPTPLACPLALQLTVVLDRGAVPPTHSLAPFLVRLCSSGCTQCFQGGGGRLEADGPLGHSGRARGPPSLPSSTSTMRACWGCWSTFIRYCFSWRLQVFYSFYCFVVIC